MMAGPSAAGVLVLCVVFTGSWGSPSNRVILLGEALHKLIGSIHQLQVHAGHCIKYYDRIKRDAEGLGLNKKLVKALMHLTDLVNQIHDKIFRKDHDHHHDNDIDDELGSFHRIQDFKHRNTDSNNEKVI